MLLLLIKLLFIFPNMRNTYLLIWFYRLWLTFSDLKAAHLWLFRLFWWLIVSIFESMLVLKLRVSITLSEIFSQHINFILISFQLFLIAIFDLLNFFLVDPLRVCQLCIQIINLFVFLVKYTFKLFNFFVTSVFILFQMIDLFFIIIKLINYIIILY